MLQPKKTKFRRQLKGVMKGNSQRGHQLAFGSFGIKSMETTWNLTGENYTKVKPGTYFLRIKSEEKILIKKIIIL